MRRPFAAALVLLALALASTARAAAPADALSDKDGRVRVQLAPRNEVVLSSEMAARIASLPLREGDAFRGGQVLVVFDCSLQQAQLAKAQATLEATRQTLTVNRRLAELNSIGALELQLAEAREKEAAAEVKYIQAIIARCAVAAPFAGRVAKRLVAAHQYVTPGTPMLGIVESGALELQLIVPSRWVQWLKPGVRFAVDIDELGRAVTARVQRIGARIDPVSQSTTVIGVIDGNAPDLLPGMSGWARFSVPQ